MITGVALPAAEAAGVRAAPARRMFTPCGRSPWPIWWPHAAVPRHTVPPSAAGCSPLGYPPRLSGSELRYRRSRCLPTFADLV